MRTDEYLEVVRATKLPAAHTTNYCIMGFLGEAGEVANKFKKVLRGDLTQVEARDGMISELGDCFWYLYALCDTLGVLPSEVREKNATKLRSRLERSKIQGNGDER